MALERDGLQFVDAREPIGALLEAEHGGPVDEEVLSSFQLLVVFLKEAAFQRYLQEVPFHFGDAKPHALVGGVKLGLVQEPPQLGSVGGLGHFLLLVLAGELLAAGSVVDRLPA